MASGRSNVTAMAFLVVAAGLLARVRRRMITSSSAVSGLSKQSETIQAKLLPCSAEGIQTGGEALRNGKLVAFPTETVYGLGANALNPAACRDIFLTKGRPLTDPLIVHVTSSEWARSLLKLSPKEAIAFEALANEFWPGPLTMVAKANPDVFSPEAVNLCTAGTGMVGVRVPSHNEARELINSAQVPVAAPSANRFGHVSPTSAQHVLSDLGAFPIYVMDSVERCSVGIESTVVGFVNIDEKQSLVLFRRGGISEEQLNRILTRLSLKIELAASLVRSQKLPNKHEEESIPQIAPGQLLTHYAPDNVETFLWEDDPMLPSMPYSLKDTVIVDFAGTLAKLQSQALGYRDLSIKGDVDEACNTVFDVLRWTETVTSAKAVLLPNVIKRIKQGSALALDDRLYRAASGRRVGRVDGVI